jgi:hypothetical protein
MKTYVLAHDATADFSDVVVGEMQARSAQQALYGFWLSCEFSFLGITRCTDIPSPDSPFSEAVQKVQLWDKVAGKYVNAWIEEKE